MNDKIVAKELVRVARDVAAFGIDATPVDVEAVENLASKFLSRMSGARMRQLKSYNIDLRPTNTVEDLARAWATVLLS